MKYLICILLMTCTSFGYIKWNPGHYITVPEYANKGMVSQEIASVKAIKGVQLRYDWRVLEPQKGVYDFSKIDADIALFKQINKKFVIFLMTKSFSDTSPLPSYMDNYKYKYHTDKAGWNIALWENEAKIRLEALVKALGEKYDLNPDIEAITFNETSMGNVATQIQTEAYFNNMIYVLEKARVYFPNTTVVQFTNYPKNILLKLTDAMVKNNIAMGGPDIFPKDNGLLTGAYLYYSKFNGVTAVMPSVQPQNYVTQCHNCPPDPLTLEQLHNYAKNNLFATHLFWTRTTTQDFSKVLAYFKSSMFPTDDAGGLNSKNPYPHPTLLFKTSFGPGVTLGPIRNFYTFGAWQDLVGKDQQTGFEFPAKNLQSYFTGIQYITYDKSDPTTIAKNIHTEIKSLPGPSGVMTTALLHNLLYKPKLGVPETGKGYAQAPFLIARAANVGDLKTLYVKYYFKFQKNLAESLHPEISSGNWRVLWEYKTGGYKGNLSHGDHRIQVTVLKNKDGKLYWMTKADNIANGPFIPKDYWIYRNYDAPVPLDQWFKFEVYLERDAVNGKLWAAIDGKTLFDVKGSTMGEFNLPLTRLFITNAYSGGEVPIESTITDLEIWDKKPGAIQ